MTDEPSREAADHDGVAPTGAALASLTADPLVLASGVLVALGVLLLLVGVTGSWHWRAAVWGAVLASAAAFALVAVAATRRQAEFAEPGESLDDAVDAVADKPVRPPRRPAAPPAKDAPDTEPTPPRPRFAGFGKQKAAPPPPAPPPPQPSNVQVMHVQGGNAGGHVRVTPTPQPMTISKPERPASRPPSSPPSTPPTIQVGAGRDPGFRTYQPVDPSAPVIQVRNRYHRPDCRYVAVADDAVQTTLGEARAANAMPCGVCRP